MAANIRQYPGILSEKYEKCIENQCISVQIQDKEFTLYSLEELFQHTHVGGEHYLRIVQMQGVLKTLREIDVFEPEHKQLLERALTIGEGIDCFLFVRRGEMSGQLYLFHTDGRYIEDLDMDLNDLIKRIEKDR